jgi:hypothetical protein
MIDLMTLRSSRGSRILAAALILLPSACRAQPASGEGARRSDEAAGVASAAAPAPAPEHRSIELRMLRLRPGAGEALVSNGIPLPEGWLHERWVDRIRLTIAGREQPIAVRALHGRHRDGSLRAVLLQTRYPLSTRQRVEATLEIGTPGTLERLTVAQVVWEAPEAVALPRSAEFLVSTGIVGPTVTVADAPRKSAFRRYEADFIRFSDFHWKQNGAGWEGGNFYDRALSHYAFWVRTGDPTFWERATALAYDYRTKYVEKAKYKSSPHWWQGDGLVVHYWLTGDERSRTAVLKTAKQLTTLFPVAKMRDPKYQWNEGRIQQRVLLAALQARSLGDAPERWGKMAEGYVDGILGLQKADGSFSWPNECGYQANFMVGLQNDALARYYDTYKADPRIPPAIKKALDYMWSTQWRAADGAFNYYSGGCTGHGGTTPAPDVNQLIGAGYGWYYRVSKDPVYRDRGDQIFAAGVSKAYYEGGKQFNEQLYNSLNYLAYRQ